MHTQTENPKTPKPQNPNIQIEERAPPRAPGLSVEYQVLLQENQESKLKILRLEQQLEMEKKQREKQDRKLDDMIIILRDGVKFIKKEQDWHS